MPVSARALVVIPTYNEAENIASLIRAIREADPSLQLAIVDDASPDGTGDRVEQEAKRRPGLHLLRREAKLGLGSAYRRGFAFGLEHGFDRILTMDADFSHHPRYLPALLQGSRCWDLVIGSRYVPGGDVVNWPPHRRALSRFANFYTRTLLRLPVRDCTSGFRCYRREVLERVDALAMRSSGYSFLEEMVLRVHRAGFRIGETPIVFEDRRAGASKISRAEIYRAAWAVLRSAVEPRRAAQRATSEVGPEGADCESRASGAASGLTSTKRPPRAP